MAENAKKRAKVASKEVRLACREGGEGQLIKKQFIQRRKENIWFKDSSFDENFNAVF